MKHIPEINQTFAEGLKMNIHMLMNSFLNYIEMMFCLQILLRLMVAIGM